MNRFLCRVIGHSYDKEAAEYYCVYHCDRCGSDNGHEPGLIHRMWIRLVVRKRELVTHLRSWWKCSECGMYFGRHDEQKDHLPF